MANETLSTVGTQKVQSILERLTRNQKEIMFNLLKKEKDQRKEQERTRLRREIWEVFEEALNSTFF